MEKGAQTFFASRKHVLKESKIRRILEKLENEIENANATVVAYPIFKCVIIQFNSSGIMDQITLKVDSRGRICIPKEIIEEIGKVVTIRKTSEGYLIIPGQQDFFKEFERVIRSKHERTGKPENWSSEKMKSIWTKTG